VVKCKNCSTWESDHLAARILSPDKLFVFWQLQDEKLKFMSDYFNLPETQIVKSLRLCEITSANGTRTQTICIQEVILRQGISSWLYKGISEKRNYVVELGIKRNEEDFFPLLRSNPIILNVKSITPERSDLPEKSPEWVGHVSTYTYYETLEGSSKK
jgi:hypothetical protein